MNLYKRIQTLFYEIYVSIFLNIYALCILLSYQLREKTYSFEERIIHNL